MKKLILIALFIAPAMTFQACNNNPAENKAERLGVEDSNQAITNDLGDDSSEFMASAASGGMMEVEAGKLAQQQGASAAVKEFGARMVADHSKANGELQAMAAEKNITLPASPMEEHQKHITEMGNMKGADFDKHYMIMMVNDHDKTVSMFEQAARDDKDADVRTWATKTLPVLKAHQAAAKAINDKLKN